MKRAQRELEEALEQGRPKKGEEPASETLDDGRWDDLVRDQLRAPPGPDDDVPRSR